MLRYVLRRLLVSAGLVLALLTLVFFVVRAVPGDPLEAFRGPDIDPNVERRFREVYGLDEPVSVQYGRWLRAFVVERDLGLSFKTRRPVVDLVRETLPNTVLLSGLALLLRFTLGLALGALAAVRRGRGTDRALMVAALIVYSMPSFWLGMALILVFAVHVQWLPAGLMVDLDHDRWSWPRRLADSLRHLILPVVVLGIGGMASTARYVRASLIEALSQDFVRTARAKGLPERRVVLRHALRNALAPVVTLLGLSLPGLVGGSIVVEHLFSWPGMGRLTIHAIEARDYPVLMATTFLSAVLVVAGNLLADVVGTALDPRLRVR